MIGMQIACKITHFLINSKYFNKKIKHFEPKMSIFFIFIKNF